MGKRENDPFYYFFRVAINPLSTLSIAKTNGASGAPVVCIPTELLEVVVVAAFTCGIVFKLKELTPRLFKLKVSDVMDALNRKLPAHLVQPETYRSGSPTVTLVMVQMMLFPTIVQVPSPSILDMTNPSGIGIVIVTFSASSGPLFPSLYLRVNVSPTVGLLLLLVIWM